MRRNIDEYVSESELIYFELKTEKEARGVSKYENLRR